MLEFAQLTTLFSGGSLAVMVFVLLTLRHLDAAQKSMSKTQSDQGAHIARVDRKLAHVMGRLNIKDEEDN